MAKRAKRPIDASSMTPSQLAEVLSRVGTVAVSASDIEVDLDAGAPRNEDGSVNVVHYAAWLVREGARGERRDAGT